MKKEIIVLIILIILLICTIVLIVMVKGKNSQSSVVTEQNITYEIEDYAYTYTMNENNILIKYPILLSNKTDLTSVNELIKERALSFFDIDEEVRQTMNIDYSVKYKDDQLISIAFIGMLNANLAAHPTNIFYTLNMDLKNSYNIKLADRYIIDENFIKVCKNEIEKQVDSNNRAYLENYTDEELKELLSNADTEQSATFTYYTNNALGISFPTIFAIGNHCEIEIDKELLKGNLK